METDESVRAGEINAKYVDIASALSAGECIVDLFDHRSSAIWDCYESLFMEVSIEHDYLEKKLMKEHGISWPTVCSNLLYIEKITVDPAYKGRLLGLATINRLIQKFGHGCTLIVLKAFPLQFESDPQCSSEPLQQISDEQKKATKKLKSHYKKIGFHEIPKSDYMYYCMGVDPVISISDLGFDEL